MNKQSAKKNTPPTKSGKKCARTSNIGRRNRTAFILLVTTIAVIIAGFAALLPFMLSKAPEDTIIRIPRNATKENVRDSVNKYFPENYAGKIMRLIDSRNIDFSKRYGAYKIPKGTDALRAMRTLVRGGQTPIRLTINHFRSFDTLAEAIAKKLDCSKEEFMAAATDSTLLAEYGLTPSQVLSLFIEDTYEVYWNSSPTEVVKKIGKNYIDVWSPKNRKLAAQLDMKPEEVMIIASIADEETNRKDEKGRIGMLYINRLHNGMRLQADPTVRFAIGNFSIQRVTRDHLAYDSPYNTYRVDGLPPGPIRTTSKATVHSILNAPPTDDLYMCAKEDFSGYHNFATTYEEHTKNALRYQHELDKRGIR
ncbi:MAG: endolytic transglycosylase MltG [Clostridium sp.]|nr:endolytic transglycosylase MltG [Prevotella sp.]MCM1428383.1 endolytic transglycosylase MltG [Clostridium sp.]MCM1474855.1 endolytic transglycosylase MltG [Muribaculaceae bacterium]